MAWPEASALTSPLLAIETQTPGYHPWPRDLEAFQQRYLSQLGPTIEVRTIIRLDRAITMNRERMFDRVDHKFGDDESEAHGRVGAGRAIECPRRAIILSGRGSWRRKCSRRDP